MRFFSTIFLLLFFLSASAQRALISGIVSSGRQPVVGASVQLQRTSFMTITDENGKFNLQNVPAGEYVLEVTSIGFVKVTKSIKVENSNLIIQVPLSTDVK